MTKSLTSIIVVNWNGKKWLKRCLDSLCSQQGADYEVVLVDNGSSDGSADFVKAEYDPGKVRVVRSEKNLGFAGGNNLGIRNARGEYIMLLNNDAWVDQDCLAKTVEFYKQHHFDIIAPIETDYENTVVREAVMKIDPLGHPIYLTGKNEQAGFYLQGVCLFFKKEFYEQTLGLDDDFFMYLEEVDWFWRLNLLGKQFSFIEGVFVHHVGAGSTGSGVKYKAFLWRNQNSLQMLLKNYSWLSLALVLPLYFLQNLLEILFFIVILKPNIAWSYLLGWWFNLWHLKGTLEKRKWVQERRTCSDFQLVKGRFYLGFAKLYHLTYFIKHHV